jgi:serine-type D-Ala-D-Ala carboxypeptidase/endopeptidase
VDADEQPWGSATFTIVGDDTSFAVEPGADPMDENTLFAFGSITKTVTGDALANAIVRGLLATDSTLGQILGVAEPAASLTLAALATHRSGLPRLPPNLDPATVDPWDPYANFSRDDLIAGLEVVELHAPAFEYSNFGFMTIAACVAVATQTPVAEVYAGAVFEPAGMTTACCWPAGDHLIPGYVDGERVGWWRSPLLGSGGVYGSIRDLAAYARAHVDVPAGTFGEAVTLATTVHASAPHASGFGWMQERNDIWWHNGASGGFRAFVAFHRPSRTAVGMLANGNQDLERSGFDRLRELLHR